MCIIIAKPAGVKMPSQEVIKNCFKNNPDGAGIAYVKRGVVRIEKGFLKLSELQLRLKALDLTKSAVLIHFRISTSGLKDAGNCHPYPLHLENTRSVRSSCDAALVHNGILPTKYIPKQSDDINDTQLLIKQHLNKLSYHWYRNKELRAILGDAIGSNKLVLLDNNNKLYFVNEAMGTWVNGIWYSNASYKKREISYCYNTSQMAFNMSYYKKPKVTTKPVKEEVDEWGEPLSEEIMYLQSKPFKKIENFNETYMELLGSDGRYEYYEDAYEGRYYAWSQDEGCYEIEP